MRPTGAELAGPLALVQFGQEGFQESSRRGRLGSGDRTQHPVQLGPGEGRFLLGFDELSHGGRDDLSAVAETLSVRGKERVDAGDQTVLQGQAGPAGLSHRAREALPEKEPLMVALRSLDPKTYGHGRSPVAVAQAAGSDMTPDDSLLVAPPSNVRLEPRHGDATKASASPNSPPGPVSGSNSIAVCQCGGQFEVRHRSDDLPYHPDPNAPVIGPRLRQICRGSGRRANIFAEA